MHASEQRPGAMFDIRSSNQQAPRVAPPLLPWTPRGHASPPQHKTCRFPGSALPLLVVDFAAAEKEDILAAGDRSYRSRAIFGRGSAADMRADSSVTNYFGNGIRFERSEPADHRFWTLSDSGKVCSRWLREWRESHRRAAACKIAGPGRRIRFGRSANNRSRPMTRDRGTSSPIDQLACRWRNPASGGFEFEHRGVIFFCIRLAPPKLCCRFARQRRWLDAADSLSSACRKNRLELQFNRRLILALAVIKRLGCNLQFGQLKTAVAVQTRPALMAAILSGKRIEPQRVDILLMGDETSNRYCSSVGNFSASSSFAIARRGTSTPEECTNIPSLHQRRRYRRADSVSDTSVPHPNATGSRICHRGASGCLREFSVFCQAFQNASRAVRSAANVFSGCIERFFEP